MRRIATVLWLAAGTAPLVGCEPAPEEEREAEESATRYAEIKPIDKGVDREADEIGWPMSVEFELWPGGADWSSSDLSWLGGEEQIDLYAEPRREAVVVGQGQWSDGMQLEWTESLVRVDEPRPFRVVQDFSLLATPYDTEFRELEARDEMYELSEGERVYLYLYAGDGTCFITVDREIVLADCPGAQMVAEDDRALDDDLEWKPLEQQWWIKVVSRDVEGWMAVSDAPVEVHSRKGGDYGDLEPGGEYDSPDEMPDMDR